VLTVRATAEGSLRSLQPPQIARVFVVAPRWLHWLPDFITHGLSDRKGRRMRHGQELPACDWRTEGMHSHPRLYSPEHKIHPTATNSRVDIITLKGVTLPRCSDGRD
jgi:hypothetical protein